MDRRTFGATFAGASLIPAALAAAPQDAAARKGGRRMIALYSSVEGALTRWEVDVASATLARRETITLPSSLQYAWPVTARRALYLGTSDAVGGARGITGTTHRLIAMRLGRRGVLTQLGAAEQLMQRPINLTADSTGAHVLVAYNTVANVSVHGVKPDGALGAKLYQAPGLDTGIFPHQVRVLPGDRSVVLVTRGNSAGANRPEDPGALKLFRFGKGQLSNLASIAVGGKGGYGYGPRHLDFHPTKPWVYVSIERQNQLHMHRLAGDSIMPEPDHVLQTTEQNQKGIHQVAGAIHVHPKGHVVYVSNRASGMVKVGGRDVFVGVGDNSIAVYAIDQTTGAPRLIQRADPHGFHVRTFTIDPSGRLLVAALMIGMDVREGDAIRHVPAGLAVFRIEPDGQLTFVRKYDVETPGEAQQLWVGMVEVEA